ncbi:hypothetical protein [Rhizobium leguminosarum]|uniref:hypothetical protein n=1 Tax=Rhizobium leguminosarum TaxID=384 RepID=UPI0013EE9E6D
MGLEEEHIDEAGGHAKLPAAEDKNQNPELDDAFSHDVHPCAAKWRKAIDAL